MLWQIEGDVQRQNLNDRDTHIHMHARMYVFKLNKKLEQQVLGSVILPE